MCKVLVLSNLALTKRKVEEAVESGTNLLFAENAREAWDKIVQNNGVDFAVIDDEMPNEEGMELLKYMRSNGLETPIVMFGDRAESERVFRSGLCRENGTHALSIRTSISVNWNARTNWQLSFRPTEALPLPFCKMPGSLSAK